MKILHPLLCYFPSQAGGPANTLYWLNSALDSNAFSTSVISTQFGLESDDSIAIISEQVSSPNQKIVFLTSAGKEFLQRGFENIIQSDLIQFSSIFFPPTLPLTIGALIKGKMILISPRGELYPAALKIKPFQKKIWLRIFKILQSKIHFHATNEFERDIIQQFFPSAKSISLIPNFVKIAPKQNSQVDRDQLLFIGRINPIKNIDVLIRAFFKVINSSGRPLKLIIAGSARVPYEIAYNRQLVKLVEELNLKDSVTFLGHIQGEDKDKLIASSSCLLLPSQSENFGNVVLEAMAQGTPVIASKNTPWGILEEEQAGYWVEGSEDALSHSILHLIELTNDAYLEMRNRAYSLCRSNFDVESNIFVWENLYKKLTNVQE